MPSLFALPNKLSVKICTYYTRNCSLSLQQLSHSFCQFFWISKCSKIVCSFPTFSTVLILSSHLISSLGLIVNHRLIPLQFSVLFYSHLITAPRTNRYNVVFIENLCYQLVDFVFFADLNLVTIYFVFLAYFFFCFSLCFFFVPCRKLVNSIILAINGREQC